MRPRADEMLCFAETYELVEKSRLYGSCVMCLPPWSRLRCKLADVPKWRLQRRKRGLKWLRSRLLLRYVCPHRFSAPQYSRMEYSWQGKASDRVSFTIASRVSVERNVLLDDTLVLLWREFAT